MKKLISTLLSTALIAGALVTSANAAPAGSGLTAPSSDIVQVRGRGGAVAAGVGLGLLGGLAVGSAIANSGPGPGYYYGRPGYVCDEYDNCYPRRGYRHGWVWDPYCDCWVRPRRYY